MAKNADNTEERIHKVEEALSRTEQFIEEHQKIITYVIGAIIVIVLGFFAFKRFYLQPREKEAQSQMYMAERYFEMDSLKQALNGDGTFPGFLTIIDDYGITKQANLAHYYAGMIYLKKGEFQKAIDYLNGFSTKDVLVSSLATGGIGDAYMELGDADKALDYYLKATDKFANEFSTPVLMMKAGWTYEHLKKYDKAIDIFKRIKTEYPKSTEAKGVDRYIARDKGLMGK